MDIKGCNVLLRAMEETDQEALRRSVNSPEIERMVGGWSFPISANQQMKWFEKSGSNANGVRLIVDEIDGEKTIGMVSLTAIDWKNRTAKEAIKLFESKSQRKGIGTDVLLTILNYAFNELNLNRVTAQVLEHNIPSIKLHERAGFVLEGVLRQAVFKEGKYRNSLAYAVLKEDFLKNESYCGRKTTKEKP